MYSFSILKKELTLSKCFFYHLGPFWAHLRQNWLFLPQLDKVGFGGGALEEKLSFCLKWSERVQMSHIIQVSIALLWSKWVIDNGRKGYDRIRVPQKKPDGLVQNFDWVREAPFWNVLALYRSCPNSFWTPLPSVKWAIVNRGKMCPKPSWKALTPPGKRLQPPPFGQCPYMEATHFKRGLS